jgi:hypothetical protein
MANWLKRDDLTPYLEDLILTGEKYLIRKLRVPEMETSFSDAMASGTLTVPAGFLGWKWAAIQGSTNRFLKTRPSQWIMENYPLRSSAGKPFYIGRDGSSFVFGPFPDSDYTVIGTYWARPTSVLSSANSVFTTNPDAYLYAALSESAPFLKNDARVPMWESKRDRIINDMNGEANASHRDSTMAVSVDFMA